MDNFLAELFMTPEQLKARREREALERAIGATVMVVAPIVIASIALVRRSVQYRISKRRMESELNDLTK